jgi:hypothetical protein
MTTKPAADDLFDEVDDDLFDPAPSDYLHFEDLAAGGFRPNGTLPGRIVIFYPETIQLNIPGDTGTYNALYGTLAVLDGPVSGRVDKVPFVINDMKVSGALIVPNTLALFTVTPAEVLGGRKDEHKLVPKDPRKFFTAGRLDSKKNAKNTLSWFLLPPKPEEKAKMKAFHVARMRELDSVFDTA